MSPPASTNITRLLVDWQHGDKAALDTLLPLVYQELHKIAASYLRAERRDHTLQATALINEAYLRMTDQELPNLESRAHFFGVASRLMRQILVDHARANRAAKRGGSSPRVSLDDASPAPNADDPISLLAFDRALKKLAELDDRKSRVIEMRAFSGMSVEDTAVALGVSVPTVKRDMRLAQAWLRRELGS